MKSKTAQSDPQYGNFERFAKEYLDTDRLSCNDLDRRPDISSEEKKVEKSR